MRQSNCKRPKAHGQIRTGRPKVSPASEIPNLVTAWDNLKVPMNSILSKGSLKLLKSGAASKEVLRLY